MRSALSSPCSIIARRLIAIQGTIRTHYQYVPIEIIYLLLPNRSVITYKIRTFIDYFLIPERVPVLKMRYWFDELSTIWEEAAGGAPAAEVNSAAANPPRSKTRADRA
jgi:hypothetical protein